MKVVDGKIYCEATRISPHNIKEDDKILIAGFTIGHYYAFYSFTVSGWATDIALGVVEGRYSIFRMGSVGHWNSMHYWKIERGFPVLWHENIPDNFILNLGKIIVPM